MVLFYHTDVHMRWVELFKNFSSEFLDENCVKYEIPSLILASIRICVHFCVGKTDVTVIVQKIMFI